MLDLSILVLLLFVCCLLFFSQFKKGEFSKMNYYKQYRSMKGFIIIPIVIMILLVAILNILFSNP
jgi:uncharacterized membrane protein